MSGHYSGSEHGDRHAFLGRLAARANRETPENVAHPIPSEHSQPDGFSALGYRTISSADLGRDFAANARRVLLRVDEFDAALPDLEYLRRLVADEGIRTAVVSRVTEARAVGELLVSCGVDVSDYSPSAAVGADLGVSSPRFGVAATGSLVQDSTLEGGRGMSLVPRLHLAVLPRDRVVATPADVLRALRPPAPVPTNLTFITGPSRTGDIEMILTVGVHGPVAVMIALCNSTATPKD